MPKGSKGLRTIFKVPPKDGVYQKTFHNKIVRDDFIKLLKELGYNYKTYELPEGIHVIEAWD